MKTLTPLIPDLVNATVRATMAVIGPEAREFIDKAIVLNAQHVGAALRDTDHAPVDFLESLAMTMATAIVDGGVEYLNARPYVLHPGLAKLELLRRFGPKLDRTWQQALDAFEAYAIRVWGTGE